MPSYFPPKQEESLPFHHLYLDFGDLFDAWNIWNSKKTNIYSPINWWFDGDDLPCFEASDSMRFDGFLLEKNKKLLRIWWM